MKNVRVAFEIFDGDFNNLKGYQFVKCHMIFDIKMGENFQMKVGMVAGDHMTDSPFFIT